MFLRVSSGQVLGMMTTNMDAIPALMSLQIFTRAIHTLILSAPMKILHFPADLNRDADSDHGDFLEELI
jgi:hypothetical protein